MKMHSEKILKKQILKFVVSKIVVNLRTDLKTSKLNVVGYSYLFHQKEKLQS